MEAKKPAVSAKRETMTITTIPKASLVAQNTVPDIETKLPMSGTEVDQEIAFFISAVETQKQCLLRLFDGQAHKAKHCDNFPQFCAEFLGIALHKESIYRLLGVARAERQVLQTFPGEIATSFTQERLTLLVKLNDYPVHQKRVLEAFNAILAYANSGTDKHHNMSLKRLVEQQLAQIETERLKRDSVEVDSYDPNDKQKGQAVGGTGGKKNGKNTPTASTGSEVVEVKPDAPTQTQTPADTAQQSSPPALPEFSPIAGNAHHGLLEMNASDEENEDTDEPDDMADAPFSEETADYDLEGIADAFQTAQTWLENESVDADRDTLAWVEKALLRFTAWLRAQGK